MQVMIRTKEFEIWKARAAATLVATQGAAIHGVAAIRVAGIQGAATQAGLLEAIPAWAEVAAVQGQQPTGGCGALGRKSACVG